MAMKESEMKHTPPEWQYSWHSYILAYEIFMGMVVAGNRDDQMRAFPNNISKNPLNFDKKVWMKDKFTIPAFGTLIVRGWTEETMMLGRIWRWLLKHPTQNTVPISLGNGLYVMGVFTELKDSSHHVRNGTTKPIHMASGQVITSVVAAKVVPESPIHRRMTEVTVADTGQKWQTECIEWLATRVNPFSSLPIARIPHGILLRAQWDGMYWHNWTHHWSYQ